MIAAAVVLAMPALTHAATWTSGGPEGVFAAGAVADPADVDHVVVLGQSMFVTHDRGASWAPRTSAPAGISQLVIYGGPPKLAATSRTADPPDDRFQQIPPPG